MNRGQTKAFYLFIKYSANYASSVNSKCEGLHKSDLIIY